MKDRGRTSLQELIETDSHKAQPSELFYKEMAAVFKPRVKKEWETIEKYKEDEYQPVLRLYNPNEEQRCCVILHDFDDVGRSIWCVEYSYYFDGKEFKHRADGPSSYTFKQGEGITDITFHLHGERMSVARYFLFVTHLHGSKTWQEGSLFKVALTDVPGPIMTYQSKVRQPNERPKLLWKLFDKKVSMQRFFFFHEQINCVNTNGLRPFAP